jgi:hypothetical protein
VGLACVLFAAKIFRLPFLFEESNAVVENTDQEYSVLMRNKNFDLEGLFQAHLLHKQKANNVKCNEKEVNYERKHYE